MGKTCDNCGTVIPSGLSQFTDSEVKTVGAKYCARCGERV